MSNSNDTSENGKVVCFWCGKEMESGWMACAECRKESLKKTKKARCSKCGRIRGDAFLTCERCRLSKRTNRWQLGKAGLCKECGKNKEAGAAYCRKCHNLKRDCENRNRRILKDEVYVAYGGFVCACCGETRREFLSLDHINNDGAEHKRKIGNGSKIRGGAKLFRWIKNNNFPTGFQVLCMNCQWGKRRGVCPHEQERRQAIDEDYCI